MGNLIFKLYLMVKSQNLFAEKPTCGSTFRRGASFFYLETEQARRFVKFLGKNRVAQSIENLWRKFICSWSSVGVGLFGQVSRPTSSCLCVKTGQPKSDLNMTNIKIGPIFTKYKLVNVGSAFSPS